jgi:hypothetical protein
MAAKKVKKVKNSTARKRNSSNGPSCSLSDIKSTLLKMQDESDAKIQELMVMCKVENAK